MVLVKCLNVRHFTAILTLDICLTIKSELLRTLSLQIFFGGQRYGVIQVF